LRFDWPQKNTKNAKEKQESFKNENFGDIHASLSVSLLQDAEIVEAISAATFDYTG
jgi:predicted membrane protein